MRDVRISARASERTDDSGRGRTAGATSPELRGCRCSMVRELHVYGSAVAVHSRERGKFQHQGYGTLLMREAERVARDEHRSKKLAVISGVGTRRGLSSNHVRVFGPLVHSLVHSLVQSRWSNHVGPITFV